MKVRKILKSKKKLSRLEKTLLVTVGVMLLSGTIVTSYAFGKNTNSNKYREDLSVPKDKETNTNQESVSNFPTTVNQEVDNSNPVSQSQSKKTNCKTIDDSINSWTSNRINEEYEHYIKSREQAASFYPPPVEQYTEDELQSLSDTIDIFYNGYLTSIDNLYSLYVSKLNEYGCSPVLPSPTPKSQY